MKVSEYNSKTREAYGKSLVDVGVAIYKALILLITIVPITVIVKSGHEQDLRELSIFAPFLSMSTASFYTLVALMAFALVAAHMFRSEGLKHIHESENDQS